MNHYSHSVEAQVLDSGVLLPESIQTVVSCFSIFSLKKAKKYGYQAQKAPFYVKKDLFYVQCLCFVLSFMQLTMKNVSQHNNVVIFSYLFISFNL